MLALSAGSAVAQSVCEPAPAKAVSVQGSVEARRAGQSDWRPVLLNDAFCPGDTIRVQDRSRADLQLLNQSVLRLNANSTITVEAPKERTTGVVDLVRGAVHFFSRGPNSLEVKTPFTIAGVRGTEFFISLEAQRALLTVFEGTVLAENAAGSLGLSDGQSAVAEAGKAPVARIVARPRDAVHWALYYPPVLYFSPDAAPGSAEWQATVRRSAEAYLKADLKGAFEQLDKVPPQVRDARLYTFRAQLLLAVGQVDAAQADIERALQVAPSDPDAASLRTIMAIVQGEKDRALQIAQGAVSAAPQSPSALIAQSYARQASFDLEGARTGIEKAVELDPRNALAWARLAELHSSFGEIGKAREAAQKAAALEPNLARTQTVLGFAHLTAIETRQAREAFTRAIALDQADPLPRLGLGLAKIRDGELDAGSRDLEVAASLDPGNALVRSYLGKAYYEEKRTPLDEREYRMARQLDPRDPTPWFYDAIQKQTSNRPIEALQDMERAIELNDSRAVYRSQLLLDSDAAARSASLGRIYSDLGFQQLALVEAWKSVNTDPSNSSAHRFLADSYAARPRHEIARVSELLQSQLLQPLNMTPIQPSLAESNLFLISAGGPEALSFNEFNPLFNRNGLTLQARALAGSHDTRSGEAVLAGIHGRSAFSAGYTEFRTDGWRQNARQDDRIANAFWQLELSPQTSVQAEVRRRDTEIGDLELRFFPQDTLPNRTLTQERSTYRLGARHAFAPDSILLASLVHQRADFRDIDFPPFGSIEALLPDVKASGGELQHLLRSRRFSITSGVGHVETRAQQQLTIDDVFFPPPVVLSSNLDARHSNGYLYAHLNYVPGVTFTVGASYDEFDTDNVQSQSRQQFNPKLGITWSPRPHTTVRAAAFRVLTRSLVSDQTLEPTQVAGFNQFFDDAGGSDSRRYGAAIDQRFSRKLFGGVEVARRDLTIPFEFIDFTAFPPPPPEVRRRDSKELAARGYLFWTPLPGVALSAEYQRERFENDQADFAELRTVQTHKVPLGLRLFHPSGLSASLRGTYYRQHGEFRRLDTGVCCEAGKDKFFLVDAAVSYRLPQRRGLVSIGATNLFDQQFMYQETDLRNASIQPERMAFIRLTLAF